MATQYLCVGEDCVENYILDPLNSVLGAVINRADEFQSLAVQCVGI